MITPGKYKHYKGNFYEVMGTAIHSETMEEMVLYKPLYGEEKLFVRPLKMFTEIVVVDGKEVPRFESVEEKELWEQETKRIKNDFFLSEETKHTN